MAFPARPSLELPLVGGVQNETDSGFLPAYHENGRVVHILSRLIE